jgi:ELWxxDGT repeat protein
MKPLLVGPVALAFAGVALASPLASAQAPYLVADIDATAPGASSNPSPIGVLGDRLFFVARRPDVGQDLWTTTGSAASTIPLELTPGPVDAGASLGTVLGDALLFQGYSGAGQLSLWTSDGTPAGTRSLLTGPIGSDIAVLEDRAFFGSGPSAETSELWTSDGTLGGTRLLKEILPGAGGSHPLELTPLADRILFTVDRDPPGAVPGVWLTDGTAEGTRRLVGRPCTRPLRVASKAYMFCASGAGGFELWGTDGTPGGTARVVNLDPPQGSTLGELTNVEGTLFFRAGIGTGERLWKSDGTAVGTVQVQGTPPFAEDPISLTPSDGVVFFVASTAATGAELWRSDGTNAGTYMVRDIVPGAGSGLQLDTDQVMAVPGGVVFAATTPALGNELWFSDGTSTGTFALGDIEPGPGSSDPDLRFMRIAGRHLYFAAHSGATGRELWAVDLPPAVAVASTSLHEGDAGSSAAAFAVTLTAAAAGPVTVSYTTAAGTAQPGSDFLATAGTLTFAAGSVGPLTVSVPVLGDLADEPNESFSLVLSGVAGAAVQDRRADAVILDDDGPSISIADVTVAEGDAGTTAAQVTVTLTTRDGAPLPEAKTVSFATEGGTATAGIDFDDVSGVLTFAARAPSGSAAVVAVPIRGDTIDEPNEAFIILFAGNGDETVSPPVVTVHVQDDDGIESAAPTEIAPGSVVRTDLAAPIGRTSDRDYYVMLQQPQSSYEVVVDETSGDAVPLSVQRVAGDGSTVQTASPTGTGASLSLRWQNTTSVAVTSEHLAVSSAACGSVCGADDRYRLRLYETTLSAPRFNNVNGQGTVVLLQNRSQQAISGRLLFWMPAGWLGHEEQFVVPARGALAINTLALYPGSGSLTVSHDGSYGALVGKAVALEPATGFSFDTPLTSRPR